MSSWTRVETRVVNCTANAMKVTEAVVDLALLQHLDFKEGLIL